MQVGGCNICGGAYESGACMAQDDMTKENRQGFHSCGLSGYQQGGNFSHNKGQGWRSHPGNQFNKDQRGPSNRPPNQGPNLYEGTTKLEDIVTQFMQVSMSNHKSTKSTIKNLEIQVGQLAKQLAENSSGNFRVNTKKNPKEECKAMITRSQGRMLGGKESKNTKKVIENMASNNYEVQHDRTPTPMKKREVLELNSHDALLAQNNVQAPQSSAQQVLSCALYGGDHLSDQCFMLSDCTSKGKDTLNQFIQISITNQKNTNASIKNLEVQMGQIAKEVAELKT
ncbi:hypothetical protein GmHk_07G020009 [Glycine max]|nr:hypothetical protein GmHk_07G020009 [Glycine max]